MNTNLNNEDFPRLTPPNVVYEHKAALKKPMVIPLYAKIVAAAAAVALLFGIFWLKTATPEVKMMAELKPIKAERIESNEPLMLAESRPHFVAPKKETKTVAPGRIELPMLAELQPIATPTLIDVESQPDLWSMDDLYYAYSDIPEIETSSPDHSEEEDYDDDRSLIGRGISMMTEGEHDDLAGILSEGLQSFKGEMASLAMTLQSSRSQLRQRVR